MQIILFKDVRGLGRKSEIKDVKEGYARNFLLPEKLAGIATPEALQKLANQKIADSEQKKLHRELAARLIEKLAGDTFEFRLKAGDKGEVFGSITAKHIEEELSKRGYGHPIVILKHPIKILGDFTVEIDFGDEIKTALTMRTVREE